MTNKIPCPICRGGLEKRGFWKFTWLSTCRSCNGVGFIPDTSVNYDAYNRPDGV
jgi:DnaJ-class molecular chaperone